MNNQYQNPSDCGSPNKYQGNDAINDVGNSYSSDSISDNAQSDIGFNAGYGAQNAEGTAGKKYMCSNCGTMHYGNEAPKNCCKCDSCCFREV